MKSAAQGLPAQQLPKAASVSEPDMESIVKFARDDSIAIEKFGSREAATEAGYKFASPKLPWQKLRTSTDVDGFVANVAKVLSPQMDTAKGGAVLSDARVREMVSQRAQVFNEDPEMAMGMLIQAGDQAASLVANMEASYLVAQRMMQDTYDTAFRIRNGMLNEWGGDAIKAGEELKARLSASADLLASARSMSSNSGRALRRMRGEFSVKPEDVAKLQGLDAQQLVDVVYATKGDPKKLARAMNPAWMERALGGVQYSLTNSLLWFYPTHLVNLSTNLYMLAARPTEKLLGSIALGAKGSGVRKQAMKEYAYTGAALGDAWEAMVEAFKRGDSVMTPHQTENFEVGRQAGNRIPWRPLNSIWDVFANGATAASVTLGLPTRSLGAVDEFVKQLRYRAVVQARSAVEASTAGLGGQAFTDYVQRSMDKAFDEGGRALDGAAMREAQTATFQSELDYETLPGMGFGKGIRNLKANVPSLGIVLPFVKTPINVLRYAWKMTPGLNLLQTEYRKALTGANGAEAQAHAVGQMMLGSTFSGMAAMLAVEGRLTGGGPSDPKLKKQLTDSGWRPYSIVWTGDDGEKKYFPLGRFDPIGMPFGMIADLVDMQLLHPGTKEAEGGMSAVALALAQNFSEKTFLLNINQLMRAVTEPGTYLEKYMGSTAGSAIPFSALLRGTNPDPYMRDARGFIDNMMRNMPGYSETLPPSRDIYGDPVWRRVGLTTSQDNDLVEAEHQRIMMDTGYGIGPANPQREGVDLRDVVLEDGRNAYDALQELAGHPEGKPDLKDAMAKAIKDKRYALLPDGDAGTNGTKLHLLSGIVAKYREAAFKTLMKKSPKLRAQVMNRQMNARAAFVKNKAGGKEPGAKELLDVLGYGQQGGG